MTQGGGGDLDVVGGDLDVAIRGGRVVAVGADVTGDAGVPVVDATGGVVAPGFIDLQCNGAGGIDLTAEPERLWELAALLPRYGVTAWLPTIVTSPATIVERALAALADRPAIATWGSVAEPLGLHLEGPFLSPERLGAHDRRHLARADEDAARAAGWSREAGVAMVTLAPERPGALDLVRSLVAGGVVVAAGHSDATVEDAIAAVDAGVTAVTHLFNAMAPMHHRSPGLAGAALTDTRLRCGVIADGVHLHPRTVAAAWAALGDRLVLVTDAVAALDAPAGPVRLGAATLATGTDAGAGVRLADGTLAGSDLSMDRAVRNLVAFTGCSLASAVAAASAAPAAVLGLEGRGPVAPGAVGDLVVLTPGGEVLHTVVGGRVAWRS